MSAPRATKGTSLKELTLRGIIIGGIITLVFTAANVYLGLKVGLTFATSIPAAVISMAVLRFWGDHTVQENNIVQTIASAAGTLSAVIFVLPGLVIVGWWSGFPYWQTMFVCAVGGSLGVMYSIPLRRALVTGSDLPYPEGVAGAEILKVGDSQEAGEDNKRGLLAITWGALASAAMALFGYLKVTASEVGAAFRIGSTGTMLSTSLSLAKGVLGGGIDWKLLGIGAAIGVVVIIIDEVLRPASKGKLALPPLAVGMGIYLPASLTILIPIGGLIGFLYNRWADKQADVERAKRFGTLAATGLIVGESLFGVVYAGIAGATGSESPLALPFIGDGFTPVANVLGIVFFAGATWLLYGFARKITRDADRESASK